MEFEQAEREKNYQQRIIDHQTNQITGIKTDLDKASTRAEDYHRKLDILSEQHRNAQIAAEAAQASNIVLKVREI